ISGINNFSLGGSGGRGRNIMGRLSRFGKGGSSLGRAGSMGGRSGSLIGKAKGRGGLIFAISLIGFMLLVGGLTAFAPPSTPGTAAPITGPAPTSPVRGLDYTLPLKDPSIQPLDIRTQVKAAFPGAKLEYWDKIIQSSIAAGFNPALALALWIEETEASQATLAKNGGSEIATGGTFSKGHFGCAPWEDQTIDESLSCLIKFSANYTNDQFPEFMAAYSGGPAGTPFSNNPNFPANVKNWYSQLVPSGNGALTPITPVLPGTPSGPSGFVFYCQGNTQWQSICSLGSSGCGPSSLAMVLTTFQASCNGNVCTPLEVDKVFTTNVWRSCGGPSSMYVALQSDWLKNLGFEVGPNLGSGATLDSSEAKKYLDQGYYIIGSSGQYPCANCKISGALIDHIFVIDAIDIQANTVDIRDPNNCSYTDGDDENQSNRTKSISAFPWLYAYPIKKVR
ncbi:TPA: hypothetical protein DEQ89_01965, partial [Candidatus Daviesbacteria bacterium]|nr:hypothetical protein [Candidatus Daviesbacteria bacterium]